WKDDITQFVDGGFGLRALCVLEFFYSVQNLAKIPRRIDGQFVAHVDSQNAGKIASEHGRLAIEIELSFFNESADRDHFFLRGQVDSANHRRQSLILEFHNHRALDKGRGRDHVRRVRDLFLQRAPVTQNVLTLDENVCVEIDDFLAQLAIESGHYRNHKNHHGHAQGHTDDRDQRDDGKKGAFGFEITQREKKTERQFQIAVMLAVNLSDYNPTGCRA